MTSKGPPNCKRRKTIMLLALVRYIQAWRNYYRNLAELSQLNDRDLADIGLSRSDIPRIASQAFPG